ncbi:MAG: YCF48-related protein [bacterium]
MKTSFRITLKIAGMIILFGLGFIYVSAGECDTPTTYRYFSLDRVDWENPIVLIQGETATVEIEVKRHENYQDSVDLITVGDVPTDVTISFDPNPVTLAQRFCTCTMTAHVDAAVQEHRFHIKGFAPSRKDSVFVILKVIATGASWSLVPGGGGRLLHDVHFADANTAYMVGDLGTIIKTSDGGESLVSLVSGTEANLLGVHFTHPDTGVVVGFFGTILRTTDGGQNWTPQGSITKKLDDVYFVDSNHGFAVGEYGAFASTEDGGDNWVEGAAVTTDDLATLWFQDDQVGMVAGGNGAHFKTYSGGANWDDMGLVDATVTDLFFIDDNQGFMVGAPSDLEYFNGKAMILSTPDFGNTWSPIPANTTRVLQGVAFKDADVGVVVGEYGIILSTADGGETWVEETYSTHSIRAVDWFPGQRPLAVGTNGLVLRRSE